MLKQQLELSKFFKNKFAYILQMLTRKGPCAKFDIRK